MAIIYLGLEGDSSSVYELISIIGIEGCDGNIVYEIHNQMTADKSEPHAEFVNRSKPFYKTFVNPGFVDQWASNDISYAAKIENVWYFVVDTGSNTYLGSGPSSTLAFREFCFKKEIKILYIESPFQEWKETLLSNREVVKEDAVLEVNEAAITEIISPSKSYHEINRIIKLCGDGIARINLTAAKFNENNFRDLFLAAIHSHKQSYSADGEATNKEGRTDLKISDTEITSKPTYLYEFKIHKKTSDINAGLTQITKKYATVNDRYNGLLLINKKNIDLSKIIETIISSVIKTGLKIDKTETPDGEHMVVVYHKHPLDETINCILAIFLFDIQQSLPSRQPK